MNRETELSLLPALKRGDEAAFDTFYEAHRARVFSFLVRLGRDRHVAEELLEETWLRLVAKAHTLADDSRVLPWLLTVARNLFLSHRRSRAMDVARVQELTHIHAVTGSGISPFEATAGTELERQIERAMAVLPLHHREALLLVAFDGLTPTEAAAVCGVRPEALRQRLSRARAGLARELAEAGVDLAIHKQPRLVRDA